MRTTITLDDQLAEDLKKRAYELKQPFKQVVNDTLRAGLRANASQKRPRYKLQPTKLGGARAYSDLDKALRIADELEDEEMVRKLQLRK